MLQTIRIISLGQWDLQDLIQILVRGSAMQGIILI